MQNRVTPGSLISPLGACLSCSPGMSLMLADIGAARMPGPNAGFALQYRGLKGVVLLNDADHAPRGRLDAVGAGSG